MVSFFALTMAASAVLATASPVVQGKQAGFTPGRVNNTQEFYIKLHTTHGPNTYEGYYFQAYHTGAGLADPVFVAPPAASSHATLSYLNGSSLAVDVGYILAFDGFPGDTNYARWEPISLGSSYGVPGWKIEKGKRLVLDNPEFDGFIACEWVHGINIPQLFVLIGGFDGNATDVSNLPSSCSNIDLIPEYI